MKLLLAAAALAALAATASALNFPYARCEVGLRKTGMAVVSTLASSSDGRYCFKIAADDCPDKNACCTNDAYKLEIDVDPSCKAGTTVSATLEGGGVQEIAWSKQPNAPAGSLSLRLTFKAALSQSAAGKAGKQLCIKLGGTCRTLQQLCRAPGCKVAISSSSRQCCPVTTMRTAPPPCKVCVEMRPSASPAPPYKFTDSQCEVLGNIVHEGMYTYALNQGAALAQSFSMQGCSEGDAVMRSCGVFASAQDAAKVQQYMPGLLKSLYYMAVDPPNCPAEASGRDFAVDVVSEANCLSGSYRGRCEAAQDPDAPCKVCFELRPGQVAGEPPYAFSDNQCSELGNAVHEYLYTWSVDDPGFELLQSFDMDGCSSAGNASVIRSCGVFAKASDAAKLQPRMASFLESWYDMAVPQDKCSIAASGREFVAEVSSDHGCLAASYKGECDVAPPAGFPYRAACERRRGASPFVLDRAIEYVDANMYLTAWYCFAVEAVQPDNSGTCGKATTLKQVEFYADHNKRSIVTDIELRYNNGKATKVAPVWGPGEQDLLVVGGLNWGLQAVRELQPKVCLQIRQQDYFYTGMIEDLCLGGFCWAALVDSTQACCSVSGTELTL